ncbi:hypothetical protein RJT34_07654 [Clitoria ternatea]|uniref:Transmembrane protein n=1 Tax=Clitoria ternatea TaxID=43366 RepID=A0AAN9K6S6_CLITE
MAKPKTTKNSSKPHRTSIFLCCFGSSLAMESSTIKGSDPISKQKKKKKHSWFSWRKIVRINKNSTIKTVPLEPSISHQSHYSKSRSKSTLHKSQAPATNSPPPLHPPPVHTVTPYYTPAQTTHGGANNVEDTRQQGRASPSHAKRQGRRLSSSMQSQTTLNKAKNARNSYDPVVGMSVLAVTLVIMIFWGRLCAILCTSVWLYFVPRFRNSGVVNDSEDPHKTMKSKDVDMDSEEYKKKVIMEGLLERNHRTTL